MRERLCRMVIVLVATAGLPVAGLAQQEPKTVPKDSVRVFVPGCSKNYVFTAERPAEDQPGGAAVPEGTHLRMAGPKKLIADIRAHEGSRIEITGLIKRGQELPGGIGIGRGGRVGIGGGGPAVGLGNGMPSPGGRQIVIDVEGWRQIPGECTAR